jgi:hypothetical protein
MQKQHEATPANLQPRPVSAMTASVSWMSGNRRNFAYRRSDPLSKAPVAYRMSRSTSGEQYAGMLRNVLQHRPGQITDLANRKMA